MNAAVDNALRPNGGTPRERQESERATAQDIRVCDIVKLFNGVQAVRGVSFEVERGQVVTLLGPSGCGKTTTLRLVAGLEHPDLGQVWIGDRIVSDPARGIFVPPERRGIGMVFQSYAVWPHMTVFENVAYPLRAHRTPAAQVRERVEWALALVGLSSYAQRPAPALSGGQQQRVAIARAIVGEPAVLLMDEPLSNLDAKLRAQTRYELKELQARLSITTIYVTHDQSEAMVLSDRIIVMNNGVIEQVGNAQDIYERPTSRFVSEFVGAVNSFDAFPLPRENDGLDASIPAGCERWRAPSLAADVLAPVPPEGSQIDKRWTLMARPEDILLSPVSEPRGDGRASECQGVIALAVYLGDHWEYQVTVGEKTLQVLAPRFQQLEASQRVDVVFRPGTLRLLT